MSDYIERKRIEEFFDGIYDCADLTFEPDDHCCAADDCAHCKWIETKNAIRKRILSIPAADVREVVLCRDCRYFEPFRPHDGFCKISGMLENNDFFCAYGVCPNFGEDMREES